MASYTGMGGGEERQREKRGIFMQTLILSGGPHPHDIIISLCPLHLLTLIRRISVSTHKWGEDQNVEYILIALKNIKYSQNKTRYGGRKNKELLKTETMIVTNEQLWYWQTDIGITVGNMPTLSFIPPCPLYNFLFLHHITYCCSLYLSLLCKLLSISFCSWNTWK